MQTDPESFVNEMICQLMAALAFLWLFYPFFFKLVLTCRLYVIYVREDNYSIV